jgi:hypothetical protein
MLHRARHALFLVLTSFVLAPVVAQQADAPNLATQSDAKPADNPSTPGVTSLQGGPSANSPPAVAPAAAKSAQLPPVHVNGGPSEDILRSARDAGFKIKVANGKTHFCKTGAAVGTRFETESCMDEPTVRLWLERAQEHKDRLSAMKGSSTDYH